MSQPLFCILIFVFLWDNRVVFWKGFLHVLIYYGFSCCFSSCVDIFVIVSTGPGL
jgi:hypothetical protein